MLNKNLLKNLLRNEWVHEYDENIPIQWNEFLLKSTTRGNNGALLHLFMWKLLTIITICVILIDIAVFTISYNFYSTEIVKNNLRYFFPENIIDLFLRIHIIPCVHRAHKFGDLHFYRENC